VSPLTEYILGYCLSPYPPPTSSKQIEIDVFGNDKLFQINSYLEIIDKGGTYYGLLSAKLAEDASLVGGHFILNVIVEGELVDISVDKGSTQPTHATVDYLYNIIE
jgi:hypothetical protein